MREKRHKKIDRMIQSLMDEITLTRLTMSMYVSLSSLLIGLHQSTDRAEIQTQ